MERATIVALQLTLILTTLLLIFPPMVKHLLTKQSEEPLHDERPG